jgi:mevalonate kinase
MIVKASAPGKVYLIGEHSVVYGKPAILAAVDRRIIVEAEQSDQITVSDPVMHDTVKMSIDEMTSLRNKMRDMYSESLRQNDFSELFGFFRSDASRFKIASIAETLDTFDIEGGVSIKVTGNMLPGSGMGSSAALSVAIVQGIASLYDIQASKQVIYDTSFKAEQFVHGTPSGADNAMSAYGGMIWFRKGNPNKIISLINEIPHEIGNFSLVSTFPEKVTTGELVQKIRNLDETFRDERINNLGNAAYRIRDALKYRNIRELKETMNFAQKNLKELGLSTPEIDKITAKVMSLGGAAKISGAGGGGIIICYSDDPDQLKKEINKMGFEVLNIKLGAEGVRVE